MALKLAEMLLRLACKPPPPALGLRPERARIDEGENAMISGPSSLRAKRSNPGRPATAEKLFWIASSLSLLAMTAVPANRPDLIAF
jgi:hypothetical protein